MPYIPYASTRDADVLDWLRQQSEETIILSICGGSQMVADAGLLTCHRAASHHTLYPILSQAHPEVSWTEGLRYVDDDRIVSSAGVTSRVDATLYTLRRLFGRDVALATSQRMGYPYTQFLDDPVGCSPIPGASRPHADWHAPIRRRARGRAEFDHGCLPVFDGI